MLIPAAGELLSLCAGLTVFAALGWRGTGPAERLRQLRDASRPAATHGGRRPPRRWRTRIVGMRRWLPGRPRDSPDDDTLLFVAVLASLAKGGVELPRSMEFLAGQFAPGPLGHAAEAAAAAGASGGSVSAALASTPAMLPLQKTLTVTERTGAPLSETLACLADGLADELDSARAVQSALAGPRATAGLLTLLPLIGLGLGMALGADPIAILWGTAPGRVCLVSGAALAVAGWWWSRRLIRSAST